MISLELWKISKIYFGILFKCCTHGTLCEYIDKIDIESLRFLSFLNKGNTKKCNFSKPGIERQ